MPDAIDLERALAAARDGFAHEWPADDAVADALDAVILDPSDQHLDAVWSAWRASAHSA